MQGDLSYEDMLRHTDAARVGAPEPGSEAERHAIERFCDFFSRMTPERVRSLVDSVYADNAIVHDTLVTHVGIDAIRAYFIKTAERASDVKVRVDDHVRTGNDFYVRWTMDITWSAFKKGTTTRSVGVSQIRFDRDGKVVLHHDFWDSASGFYEHLPIVGAMIRWIKRRVAKA